MYAHNCGVSQLLTPPSQSLRFVFFIIYLRFQNREKNRNDIKGAAVWNYSFVKLCKTFYQFVRYNAQFRLCFVSGASA